MYHHLIIGTLSIAFEEIIAGNVLSKTKIIILHLIFIKKRLNLKVVAVKVKTKCWMYFWTNIYLRVFCDFVPKYISENFWFFLRVFPLMHYFVQHESQCIGPLLSFFFHFYTGNFISNQNIFWPFIKFSEL